MLKVENLHVRLEEEDKAILKGVDLEVPAGKVHAIMGPNGSGKSTLSYVLSGREGYTVTDGTATLDGADLLALEPEERAAAGLFLAFQYPVEIPGVSNMVFLRTALNAQRKARGEAELNAAAFLKVVRARAKDLAIDADMLKRPVNVGFSGGEKKRNEILQMAVLEPRMCILDETDSGLDVDAMKLVAEGVNALRAPDRAFLVITHYQRLLDHIVPDVVHIMADGRIVAVRRPRARPRGRDQRLRRHPRGRGVRGGVMAVPALKLDGAQALLAAWPEPRGEAAWATAARTRAARRLAERGAPVRRDEYFRYTDPASLTVQPAIPAAVRPPQEEPIYDAIDRVRLVFVDGVFAPDKSDAADRRWCGDHAAGRGAQDRHPLGPRPLRPARSRWPDPGRPPARGAQHRPRHGRLRHPRHRAGREGDQLRLRAERRGRRRPRPPPRSGSTRALTSPSSRTAPVRRGSTR